MALHKSDPMNLFELMSNSSVNKWRLAILEKWNMSIFEITIDQWNEFRNSYGNRCNGLGIKSIEDFDRALAKFKTDLTDEPSTKN